MKITATKENLLTGVSAVQKAVSSKTTMPILACLRLEARGSYLYFTATDLEMAIQCHVPVELVTEGIAVVPARHFSEIVRKLPDTEIEIKMGKDNELLISYEESELSIKTQPADEFPNMPEISAYKEIKVKGGVLRQMIRQTIFAAGTDEGRPLFTGVLFEYDNVNIRLIATDTHRLALRQGSMENTAEGANSCIIPAKILAELGRLIRDEEEICNICITKNLISCKIENILIVSRLLEGQFPNYKQVIPNKYNMRLCVANKKLQEAVERIALFATVNDTSNTVNLKTEDTKMTISSKSEIGHGYEQLSIESEGEDIDISFNARYLLDAFKVMDAETISLEFNGPLSPCILRPLSSDNYICLLLPVRT